MNGSIVSTDLFNSVHTQVETLNTNRQCQASPFEILTATAFQIFATAEPPLDLAVVEVGMGGKGDATNVCPSPLVTAITSIGLDHQASWDSPSAKSPELKQASLNPVGHAL